MRDLIWVDGPLLSLYEHNNKTYLVKWADTFDEHVWLVIEVGPGDLYLYLTKELTLREVEERSPTVFIQEGPIEDEDASWTQYENIPEEWKATEGTSFYDESLQHGQ